MLKDLLKNREFKKISQKILECPHVVDLIIYGSLVRGKEDYRDIDVMILWNSLDREEEYSFRKMLQGFDKKIEVVSKTYADLFSGNFLAGQSILAEGHSMLTGRRLSEGLGFESFVMFIYSLNKKNNSEKTKFYYALNGRGRSKGISQKIGLTKLGDGKAICPIEHSQYFEEFLDSWDLEFKKFKILSSGGIAK